MLSNMIVSLGVGPLLSKQFDGRRPQRQVRISQRLKVAEVKCAHDAPFAPIKNTTVVVTGANRGIGLEFCKQLLEKENKVVAACRNKTPELLEMVSKYPDQMFITELDVSSSESIGAWAENLATEVDHVDVCINNAGTTGLDGYNRWTLESVSAEDLLHTFKINTVGPTLVVQQLLQQGLIGRNGKSVIGNVTSKVGSVDDNGSGGGYAYRASKSALNNINKSMSIDLNDRGITCVLLHPGWVRTAMTQGRGLIDTDQCVEGLIQVMEGEAGPLNGCWYDYKFEAIPW
ncbi:hypothetical protein CYMTET_8040 [Cymbomonas tetramitiformis]|uniref:Uncharacterized protein n=1 Tax=Cymbomonas tetramitiformis TaxID=36881 RepID=A0AAE0GUG4_9CHLO|nr:hypothetical protein CYMTET_8040 [Cymbomonas tetramitiformis]